MASCDISLKIVVLNGWRCAPMALRIGQKRTASGRSAFIGRDRPRRMNAGRSELGELASYGAVGVGVAVDIEVVAGRVGDQLGGGIGSSLDTGLGRERRLAGVERGHQVDDHRPAGALGALVDVGLGRLL